MKRLKKESQVWFNLADEHWKDANWLLEGRRYSACLYYCHQTLEKIIKCAIIERKEIIPPKIHVLESLARKSGLDFSKDRLYKLTVITKHFWRVRYPDYQKAVYTNKAKIMPTLNDTKEIYLWIRNILLQES